MKKTLFVLLALSLLYMGSISFAGPINNNSADGSVWLRIANWVEIEFDNDSAFYFDLAAGDAASASLTATKNYTIHKNCGVDVTGSLVLPSGMPIDIAWDWYFSGQFGSSPQSVIYPNSGPVAGTVTIVASGNNIAEIAADLWQNVRFSLIIRPVDPVVVR